jgi:hypothetical protein
MNADDFRKELQEAIGLDESVHIHPEVLKDLSVSDLPEGVRAGVGIRLSQCVWQIRWEGEFYVDEGILKAEINNVWSRKYWDVALGLEYYFDLVSRAVERRSELQSDVRLDTYEDDGVFIQLVYTIDVPETNLEKAYLYAKEVQNDLHEVAQETAQKVVDISLEAVQRLSILHASSLDELVEMVKTAKTSNEKGRSLEELICQLFETIPGFSINRRVLTATEEIDIVVLNGSDDPRFKREKALLLAECKNWSGKCGKNDFVLFKEKIENRSNRCSLGFLISWNGFAETVTKEMLRGSREETLVVPLDGDAIRKAVREGNFLDILFQAWDKAVTL